MKSLIALLFVSTFTFAQAGKKPANEWDQLDAAFVSLFKTLEAKDHAAFKKLSLPAVDCIDCVGKPEFNKEGYFVTADVFFYNIAGGFTKSAVYKALTTRGYTFSTAVVKGFKPRVMPQDYPEDLTLYEVWVPTYKVDELSKGHPGTSHGFQFVKINGEFKFYGLTSIP